MEQYNQMYDNIMLELFYAKSPLHNFKQRQLQRNHQWNIINNLPTQQLNMQREMQLVTMHMHVVPMEQNFELRNLPINTDINKA